MTQRRRRQPLVLLDKERLAEINEELRISGFSNAKWFELGLSLGLSLQTLKNIETDYGRAGASRCLMECLEKWLSRADNVTGPLSWITLANGLRRIGETSSAEMIISDPASGVFQRYSVRLSAVSISEESVDLLCREKLISNETRTGVESVGGFLLGDTLREIRTSITEDHNKLRALGDILLKSDEAKTIGQGILKECDITFSNTIIDSRVPDSSVVPISSVEEVFVSEVYNCRFDEVRVKFGDLRYEIIQLVVEKVPSADDIKEYLSFCFPEVKQELLSISTVKEIMGIIESRCNIINIVPIKAIVNKYHITGALKMIKDFEEAVDDFCSKIKVKFMLNKKLSLAVSSLTCERVEFVLEWEPDEHTLDDIRRLLEKAFEDLGKRIIVRSIHRGNSIIIICYGPHHLLAALLLEAQDNLTVLMKEFSLIRLTIGHYTVYDKRIRYKVMNNECLAEEIKLADGEEQKLRSLLDYKEGSVVKHKNIISKRKERELKVKLLTKEKFINNIFKSRKSEIQYLQTSLLMKAGREEALVEYKKEIEFLQNSVSLNSMQSAHYAEKLKLKKPNILKKHQSTQSLVVHSPLAEYQRGDHFFSEEEQLEGYKAHSYEASLDKDLVFSSHVCSMLEFIQLFQFMIEQEISLPILHKIRNDLSSNDEKASLFSETINDDPILVDALRQDKEQHDKGIYQCVNWYSDSVYLQSASPLQSREVIRELNINHKKVLLEQLPTNSVVLMLSSKKLHGLNLRRLEIDATPLTNDCIQYLCTLLTNNKLIQELFINTRSISDRGVANICQVLENNSTLTVLDREDNPLITSTSSQSLSQLLLNNSSLNILNLRRTSLSTEAVLLILQSLSYNKSITKLRLDYRHVSSGIDLNYYPIQDRVANIDRQILTLTIATTIWMNTFSWTTWISLSFTNNVFASCIVTMFFTFVFRRFFGYGDSSCNWWWFKWLLNEWCCSLRFL
uniref:Death domain-containing protein n=1 Tax=Amphimedon queenslandica TaxID=400682 RepID=A0A1X7UJP3_AMPQE